MNASPTRGGTAHAALTTAPVYQLHHWLTGEAECRRRLAGAACREAGLVASDFQGDFPSAPRLVAALFRGEPTWQPNRSDEEIPA